MNGSEAHSVSEEMRHVPAAVCKEPTLAIQPPDFVRCETYAAFVAEVAIIDNDFVFHFYVPAGGASKLYWEGAFPQYLDSVAQEYFKATAPRLQATLIQDMGIDSWWLRAFGFAAQTLDPDAFIAGFYRRLDEALASVNRR
jgi:hypothetical protein